MLACGLRSNHNQNRVYLDLYTHKQSIFGLTHYEWFRELSFSLLNVESTTGYTFTRPSLE